MSRPSKMNKNTIHLLCEAIRMGSTYELACQYAGISEASFYAWRAKGRKAKTGQYLEFLESIKRAEAKGALANLAVIQKSAKDGDWKASAWILERRHGYQKNTNTFKQEAESDVVETVQSLSTKGILQSQLGQTIKASQEALAGGSYQAFAALQRQVITIAMQLKNIDAEGISDEFANLTDEDILEQISSIILSLPPVLQQKLSHDMLSLTNTNLSSSVTEA